MLASATVWAAQGTVRGWSWERAFKFVRNSYLAGPSHEPIGTWIHVSHWEPTLWQEGEGSLDTEEINYGYLWLVRI